MTTYIAELGRLTVNSDDLENFVDIISKTNLRTAEPDTDPLSIGQRWQSAITSYSSHQLQAAFWLRINRCLFGYRVRLWLEYIAMLTTLQLTVDEAVESQNVQIL